MGAHAKAPSLVLPEREPLTRLIEREPEQMLGRAARRALRRPPALLVQGARGRDAALAPGSSHARASPGRLRRRRGARRSARFAESGTTRTRITSRSCLCALTPFSALCGFRKIEDTLALFRALSLPHVSFLVDILEGLPTEDGLSQLFSTLLGLSSERRAELARETLDRCTLLAAVDGPFQHEFSWAVRIGVLYPGDIGIVSALLLNLVKLTSGRGDLFACRQPARLPARAWGWRSWPTRTTCCAAG